MRAHFPEQRLVIEPNYNPASAQQPSITVVKTILLSTVLLRCEELARVNAILNYISGCVAKVIR